jgi:hypothetical protein
MDMFVETNDFDEGDLLYQLMQDHWQVFSERLIELDKVGELLDDILSVNWQKDDGNPPPDSNGLYRVRRPLALVSKLCEYLAECLGYDEPEYNLRLESIVEEDLWRYALPIPSGHTLSRARPGYDVSVHSHRKQPWRGSGILAPPVKDARAGRANRVGEVVLYVGEDDSTSVYEVRPARGNLVSVAQLRTIKSMNVLDLAAPSWTANPFQHENLAYNYELDTLLSELGKSMSKPLELNDRPSDYFGTQASAAWRVDRDLTV